MIICQVSGRTAEPIHDTNDPILGASAVADPSHPKDFDLTFPSGLPPSASMVDALRRSDDGRFPLRAPNRAARESFLLALGVANYAGRPSDLDARTKLFPGAPPPPDDAAPQPQPQPSEEEEGGDQESPEDAVFVGGGGGNGGDSDRGEGGGAEDDLARGRIPSPEGPSPPSSSGGGPSDVQFQALEDEMRTMLERLFAKERAVTDLQRRLERSESELRRTREDLSSCRAELETSEKMRRDCHTSLRLAEKRIETHDSIVARMKGDHASRLSALEDRARRHEERDAEGRKTIRALENEKAVLTAAVEARDGKLLKMSRLRSTVESLRREADEGASVRRELDGMTAKYNAAKVDLSRATASERERREELARAKRTLEKLSDAVREERRLAADCRTQMESVRAKCQRVKAERNSFKQRADSLSKEMARICRNGMGVSDIERIMEDHESMRTEVSLLRAQKRRALEELEGTRRAHERSLRARAEAGADGEAMRALERKAELERVVSDLTEYVGAKEMQLETLKEVNRTLTEELHMMAQANLGKNEI